MKFQFTINGKKSLDKLDTVVIKRILKKLKYWQNTNNPFQFSEPIESATNLFKYRIGNYRIITSLNLNDSVIEIHRVAHRSKIYKHKILKELR